MNTIITALKEVYGLFVEDGSYTVAILLWLFIAAYALPYVGASLRAPLLLLGLLLILCENVLRSAKWLKLPIPHKCTISPTCYHLLLVKCFSGEKGLFNKRAIPEQVQKCLKTADSGV